MENVVTPVQGQKDFLKIIKKVNTDKKPVIIKPQGAGKSAVIIGEDKWNAIQETLFLINQGVAKQVKERAGNEAEDFNEIWQSL